MSCDLPWAIGFSAATYARLFARGTVDSPGRRAWRPSAAPDMHGAPKLLDLLALDEDGFRRRFRNSPVQRAKRRGLLRNVCVALGNWGDPLAVPGLVEALNNSEPLIRGHAAWALGQIGQRPEVRGQKAEVRGQRSDVGGVIWKALKTRHASELDGFVQNEINHALALFSPENSFEHQSLTSMFHPPTSDL